MFRFLDNNITINVIESQIKESILYKKSLHITLFNKTVIEITNENEEELHKIFLELQRKNNFGNFIDMR